MPAEDFSVCTDWSTAISLASFEKLRSAYSKRRMALGQAPAYWDSALQTFLYDADTPMVAGDSVNHHEFFAEPQQWIIDNCGGFVDPTIEWHDLDYAAYQGAGGVVKPLTVEEVVLDYVSGGNHLELTEETESFDHMVEVALAVSEESEFHTGYTHKGWRTSNATNGKGESLWNYLPTTGGYLGVMATGDYLCGNPTTLNPWLFEDLAAMYSVLYKIRARGGWSGRDENNAKWGVGSHPDTRTGAESAALANIYYDDVKGSAPMDMAVTYFWPTGANEVADCAALWGHGHYPNDPYFVIDVNMANDFPGQA